MDSLNVCTLQGATQYKQREPGALQCILHPALPPLLHCRDVRDVKLLPSLLYTFNLTKGL